MRIHMPNRKDDHPSGVLLGPPMRWVIYDYSLRKAFMLDAIWPDWEERLRRGDIPPGNFLASSVASPGTIASTRTPITHAKVRPLSKEDRATFEMHTGVDISGPYADRLVVVESIIRDGEIKELPFCVAAVAPDGTLFKGYLPGQKWRHLLLSRHLTYIPFHGGDKERIYAKNIKDAIALANCGYEVFLKASESALVPDPEGYQQRDNDKAGTQIAASWRKMFPALRYCFPADSRFKDFADEYAARGKVTPKFVKPLTRKRIK